MWLRNLIMSILLAVVFTWFALANSQSVTLSVLIWRYTMSLSLVVLISLLMGVIFTGIISAAEEAKLLGRIKELEKKEKEHAAKEVKANENAKV